MIELTKVVRLVLMLALPSFWTSGQPPIYTNSVGMTFVLVQPGSLLVGQFKPPYPKAPFSDSTLKSRTDIRQWKPDDYARAQKLAEQNTRDGFRVKLNRPFYIGQYEVTQAQWQRVMGTNPSAFQRPIMEDSADQHPVEQVTWQDTQQFIRKLNTLDKHHRYRLPTEFEWEYAARAGTTDDISWEKIVASAQMGAKTTRPVGKKTPNAWGIYDMLGNVWEWVEDYYNEKLFADPKPPTMGRQHVLKGASFVGDVKNATYMTHAAGPGNGWDVGFRVVMEVRP